MVVATSKRCGNIAPMTAMLLPMVLIPMLAFAVDLGYIMRAQAQLQNAADSAALAGAEALLPYNMQYYQSKLTNQVSAPNWTQAETDAKAEAQKFGNVHLAGDLSK